MQFWSFSFSNLYREHLQSKLTFWPLWFLVCYLLNIHTMIKNGLFIVFFFHLHDIIEQQVYLIINEVAFSLQALWNPMWKFDANFKAWISNHNIIRSPFDKPNIVVSLKSQFSSKAGYAFLEAQNMWLPLKQTSKIF